MFSVGRGTVFRIAWYGLNGFRESWNWCTSSGHVIVGERVKVFCSVLKVGFRDLMLNGDDVGRYKDIMWVRIC